MRRMMLTPEKHLLPSKYSEMTKYEANLVFTLHDELVEAIRNFYGSGVRSSKRKDAATEISQIYKILERQMKYEIQDGLKTSDVLRESAKERIEKVLCESRFISGD